MTTISKRILKVPSTDRIDDGIHAAAALHLNDDTENEFEIEELLWRMAAAR